MEVVLAGDLRERGPEAVNADRPRLPPDWECGYFIASHVMTDGPSQALRDYLNRHQRRLAFAACPLEDARALPGAVLTCFDQGRPVAEFYGHDHRVKGVRLWWRDFRFVWRWGWRLGSPRMTFVGVDNLNALIGLLLKRLGRCGKVIYYVIDYTPRRFSAGWLNACYQTVARWAARHSDEVWSLSRRMQEVHRIFGTRPERDRWVPVGIDTSRLRVLPDEQVLPDQLVMVSTLYPSKGIQLALEAMTELPRARLVIVGNGPAYADLLRLSRELKVDKRVFFLGEVDRKRLFETVAQSRAALAPYMPSPDSYSYYADPAKPKEYLACGVPVIITRVPWIAEPIEKLPMGLAVEYTQAELAAACRRLLEDDDFWKQCRRNALDYMRHSDWETIFDQTGILKNRLP